MRSTTTRLFAAARLAGGFQHSCRCALKAAISLRSRFAPLSATSNGLVVDGGKLSAVSSQPPAANCWSFGGVGAGGVGSGGVGSGDLAADDLVAEDLDADDLDADDLGAG